MKALINARILTPQGFKDRQSVIFQKGIVVTVCDDGVRPLDAVVERDLEGLNLLPGFVDVQVNGGGGVLFNDEPSVEGIRAIGKAHRQYGTTGFFPTLISDDFDVMKRAISAVSEAISLGVPGVLGIHLEGPFLNAQKRGVHNASKFLTLGDREVDVVSSLDNGKTIITLAPEKTTPDIIQALVTHGLIVSAGHTQATYEDTLLAMDAGLTGFTHLFNAMCPLNSREPGIIAAALQDKRAWCGIIADGHHVHPAMLRLAVNAKQDDQIFLVTDAMPCVGARNKSFELGGVKIAVTDGKCVTAEGTLAGSDLDMIGAVRNAVEFLKIDLAQAVRMASTVPAHFAGLQDKAGEIRAGLQADFVLLSDEQEVKTTWIKGQCIDHF